MVVKSLSLHPLFCALHAFNVVFILVAWSCLRKLLATSLPVAAPEVPPTAAPAAVLAAAVSTSASGPVMPAFCKAEATAIGTTPSRNQAL